MSAAPKKRARAIAVAVPPYSDELVAQHVVTTAASAARITNRFARLPQTTLHQVCLFAGAAGLVTVLELVHAPLARQVMVLFSVKNRSVVLDYSLRFSRLLTLRSALVSSGPLDIQHKLLGANNESIITWLVGDSARADNFALFLDTVDHKDSAYTLAHVVHEVVRLDAVPAMRACATHAPVIIKGARFLESAKDTPVHSSRFVGPHNSNGYHSALTLAIDLGAIKVVTYLVNSVRVPLESTVSMPTCSRAAYAQMTPLHYCVEQLRGEYEATMAFPTERYRALLHCAQVLVEGGAALAHKALISQASIPSYTHQARTFTSIDDTLGQHLSTILTTQHKQADANYALTVLVNRWLDETKLDAMLWS